jgi:proteasome lid subunit RPN8/RPN11
MINITNGQKNEIVEHATSAKKHEACGILAGKSEKVEKVYKMTNTSDTPETCYFMDPKEQLTVTKEIRSSGLELIGIYHSHPGSGAYPSAKDVELAFYPEASYVIVTLQRGKPEFRSFRIVEERIGEEEIQWR